MYTYITVGICALRVYNFVMRVEKAYAYAEKRKK